MENINANFSVLVSIYRNEKSNYVKDAFQSILNQTKVPSELVLVEDGSLNESLYDIINLQKNEFESKGIKFRIICNSQNLGLGLSLNKGLLSCTNDLVFRMDSDDICDLTRFEKQLRYLDNHQELSVIGSQIYEFVDNTSNIVSSRVVPCLNGEIIKFSKTRNPLNHMSVLIRKSDIIASGNYHNVLYFEDYELWMRVLKRGFKIGNINEKLVYARVNKDSYKRRGGFDYAKCATNARLIMLQNGCINYFEFIYGLLGNICSAFLPNGVRKNIYSKFLRT